MADGGDQAQHEHGEAGNLHDRGDGADAVAPVLDFDNLQGENQDEGELHDFVGLEVHGKARDDAGEDQPVPVSVPLQSQRSEEEQEQENTADEQQLPPFLSKKLKINKGKQYIGQDPKRNGSGLNDNGAADKLVLSLPPGGGVDEGQPEGAGRQTQPQQDDVALFKEILDGRE